MILIAGFSGCAPNQLTQQNMHERGTLDAQWLKCTDHNPNNYQTIADCSAVILSGQTAPIDLQRAFYLRGRAFAATEEPHRAVQDFTQAIRLYPDDVNALRNRCGAFVDDGQPDLAIRDCNRSIRLDPGFELAPGDWGIAYYNRGRAWSAKGQYARAIGDFNRAIRLSAGFGPDASLIYLYRGQAYRVLRQSGRAQADFERARRIRDITM